MRYAKMVRDLFYGVGLIAAAAVAVGTFYWLINHVIIAVKG